MRIPTLADVSAIVAPANELLRLRLAASEIITRHDKRAKLLGFRKCACKDCAAFRTIVEQ